MSDLQSQSPAFRQALLKSERRRIYILLACIAFIVVLRGLRTVAAPTPDNLSTLYMFLVAAAVLGLLELSALAILRRELREKTTAPRAFWLVNILVEFSLPALFIATFDSSAVAAAYRPLVNPIFLFYFLLVTLTILRLNPPLSRVCGVFASCTYLAAAMYSGWRPPYTITDTSLYSPEKLVVTYAISLLIAGLVAAVVAREFRSQVEAALREAETRREFEHLRHDLDVARSIQQSLLPHSMPSVEGWDIAAWNQPADQTGGDYYDWQPLPNSKFVFALADVTGHGIGPAMLAAVCRAYARTNFHNQGTLLKAMEEINTAVAADVQEGRFITFVAAIVGAQGSQLELLSAGHAPLFVYWLKHDRFDLMEAQALSLGISGSFLSDPPSTLEMTPGDILLLATDGFFEWANAAEELFGKERMEASLRMARGKPASEIISSLYQDVLQFAGGTSQKDDLTAIVFKRV